MFCHVTELQFNARVSKPDPKFARLLLEQFGGSNWRVAVDEIIWVKNPPFSSYRVSFTIKAAWFYQHIQKNFI